MPSENRPVHRFGVVIDLEGLPMTFALPQHLKILRRIIAINSELHPERLKWVLLLRPPQKFLPVWKVMETYFEPGTLAKIKVVPPQDTLQVLQQHVPHSAIPKFLGGLGRLPRLTSLNIPRKLLRQLADNGSLSAQLPGTRKASECGGEAGASSPVAAASPREKPQSLPLIGLPHHFMGRSSFSVKEAGFPRSTWEGPGGVFPPQHSWGSLPNAAAFPVPRPGCTTDLAGSSRQAKPIMELLDLDLFRSSEEEPIFQTYEHPGLAPQHLRSNGENRFLFVVNWIIGPFQQVVVAALNEPAANASVQEVAEWQMWQRFLSQPPLQRWKRLRVSAKCFEAPFIVEELTSMEPSHLRKYLPSHNESNGHLEVAIHLNSNDMHRLRVVFQYSCHLIVNGLAYFLCGDGPSEPREQLLLAHYCSRVDVQRIRQV